MHKKYDTIIIMFVILYASNIREDKYYPAYILSYFISYPIIEMIQTFMLFLIFDDFL
jgi:hypothetical protein